MNFGAYKRYCEFGGREQRAEPRVREFCEFGTASLRGITVLWILRTQGKVHTPIPSLNFLRFLGVYKILEKHTLRGKKGSIQWNSIPLYSYFMHFFLSFSSQTRVCPWGASHPRRRSEKGCRGKENPTLNSYILRPKFLTNYYFMKQNCHLQRGRN